MLRSRASVFCFEAIARRSPPKRPFLQFPRPNRRTYPNPSHRSWRGRNCGISYRSMSTEANPSFVATHSLAQQAVEVELLPGADDGHSGVIVEMNEPMSVEAFVSSLRASLSVWKEQGIRGVWIKLPIKLANLVQPAVEEGFWYHHAEPTYLMLVYWIPDTKHTLPVNATHRVGIGAFVMNDKKEVLAVQEKSGKFRGLGVWKFPTGVVDQGEDIFAGAIREVKEETGIDTEFLEVLAFRQSHMSFFEKSDLFFICMLRPLSFDIQKQESEIEAAQWIPIEEFAAQPFVQKHELLKYIIRVGVAKAENAYAGFVPVSIESAFTSRKSNLYLNIRDMKHPQSGSS
ncbi:Nudix hydrolase 2 [Ananas comosus]|uniref:Nudix hydrolase 2 n=1 Tax=Ananas comosus TaxID=4615 RepID=A0A199W696_ANACO|nr:Nudix hydrolase 2 [Ananas comosus]